MMSMIRGLEVWRDLDHADAIKLSRHEVIELLNEIEALRTNRKLTERGAFDWTTKTSNLLNVEPHKAGAWVRSKERPT